MGRSTPILIDVTRGGTACGGWLLSDVEYVSPTPGAGCHCSDQLHCVEAQGVHEPTVTSSCTLSTKLLRRNEKPTRRSP
eukprot:7138897-Prymnesium_polylepis.1